ncbi:hypothetical protein FOL47_001786 [Perkinsus chesapeaki]|uniref:Uncharacterized protein n=1 Tax=Perkinsus chesapeaki TaxID=330153 RepID=A0A7J6KS84_PERCH|nr:hypothetical protein FOL47_001786 [Perkinsus chesapeaki]
MHDALIVLNCSETVEWTVFHIRQKRSPLGVTEITRREAAISAGGVFGFPISPISRKDGDDALYNTDHITLIIIDAISRAHFMRTFAKTREYIEGKRSAKEAYVLGGYIATGKFTMLAMTAFQIGYFNPLTPLMEFATEDGRTKGLAQYARDGGMVSAICSGGHGFSLLAYNWKTGQLGPHH